MSRFLLSLALLAAVGVLLVPTPRPAPGCCPAPPQGKAVVNADQTVIMIWDAARKTQHFIRKATFKSGSASFGFLIPSPSQPELAESGNDAFPTLQKLTEPEIVRRSRPTGGGCGCSDTKATFAIGNETADSVRVLDEKLVAGFQAAVLEATSATALTGWLKENGYAYSPEIATWAKPYIDAGWKVTALKVAKSSGEQDPNVAAAALRLSFQTDRPLFPYREPDPSAAAAELGARSRLLRIYFLADARYRGELTAENPWTGRVAWAGRVRAEDRAAILSQLALPANTGPADWWLTEFEDPWPYRAAPADVYFARDSDQGEVRREPIVQYVQAPRPPDGALFLIAAAIAAPPLLTRVRRFWK